MMKPPAQNSQHVQEDLKSEILKLKVIQSDWEAHVRGCPYRVLEIAGEQSLHELAESILDCFDFTNDHLYGFYDHLKTWINSIEKYETDDIQNRLFHKTKVEKVFNKDKKKMLFLYDYGDEWRFIVQRMGITERLDSESYPRIVESNGDPLEQYPDFR